ncbi:MAG TPA: hypothetical protein VLZ06_11610 [Solirubrobacteraceae bacterium]|nr:hypothetical protein [Solirubrobacteraceae bacterium]
MHAAFLSVTFNDGDEATKVLEEQVIPQASGAPGFVTGYWAGDMRPGGRGMAMLVFQTEDAAQAFTDQVPRESGGGVEKVDDLFIAEVVGQT